MKYCRYCGYELEDDAQYCISCGRPTSLNNSSVNNNVNNSGNVEERNYHWAAVLALVFGILGGWLAIVFGIIGLMKCTDKNDRTMCIVGLVIGGIQIVFMIVRLILKLNGVSIDFSF